MYDRQTESWWHGQNPYVGYDAEKRCLEVELAGERLRVTWTEGTRSALDDAAIPAGREVGSADVRSLSTGRRVPFDTPFWFAVAAFRTDVRVVRD